MDLSQRLNKIRDDFENGDTPREIIDVLNAHVEELIANNVAAKAISVGDLAPMNSVVSFVGKAVPLNRFFGEHFLVLTWFRGNW